MSMDGPRAGAPGRHHDCVTWPELLALLGERRREVMDEIRRGFDELARSRTEDNTVVARLDMAVAEHSRHLETIDAEGSRAFQRWRDGLNNDRTALRATVVAAIAAAASVASVVVQHVH